MIIIGWGHQKLKRLGPVQKLLCPNCRNEDFWELRQIGTWFTFFFIPIFPYSSQSYLCCPICGASRQVEGSELESCRAQAEQNMARLKETG
ncbi:MAG: zinc-ribbon domain-containing protein [Candidatus Eremiobacteraeota bacterium]|nr:zinc-ribbon domain-containing protein [Candidatus Eremiobacteraeota bacterium]